MFCSQCGTRASDPSARYCKTCGAPFRSSEPSRRWTEFDAAPPPPAGALQPPAAPGWVSQQTPWDAPAATGDPASKVSVVVPGRLTVLLLGALAIVVAGFVIGYFVIVGVLNQSTN